MELKILTNNDIACTTENGNGIRVGTLKHCIFANVSSASIEHHVKRLLEAQARLTHRQCGECLEKWAHDHYWDSLEDEKDLILAHLRQAFKEDTNVRQAADARAGNPSGNHPQTEGDEAG